LDAGGILHEQRRPLVGGKAAAETDGQGAGIEHIAGGFDSVVALAPAAALAADAAADERDQEVLQRVVRFPQLARIDVVDVLPNVGLTHFVDPIGREMPVIELHHLLSEPGRNMHAVRDMADRNFFFHAPGQR